MGSLMAGWDSPVLSNPDTFRAERNKSLTKEEIQSFWKLQKKAEEEEEEEEHGEVETKKYSTSAPSSYMDFLFKNFTVAGKLQHAKSGSPKSPRSPKLGAHPEVVDGDLQEQPGVDHESDYKLGDWWTRSTWAFLNEPPQDRNDESAHKYKPQFDVARMATTTERA